MVLIIMSVLLSLIGSSLEFPQDSLDGINVNPGSLKNILQRTLPLFQLQGRRDSVSNEYVEEQLKQIDFQGSSALDYLSGLGQNTKSLSKREVVPSREEENPTLEFIEEKLIEQGQALEHLVKMVKKNEEITKQLLENLSQLTFQPRLPEKLKSSGETKSTSKATDIHEGDENSIARIGKNLPKYGSLLKSLVVQQVKDRTDPTPLLEVPKKDEGSVLPSRRSNNEHDNAVNSGEAKTGDFPWCQNAFLCHKTSGGPVCGYDASFGYGIFDDICHMLGVNCYWHYNFTLASACKANNLSLT